MPTNTDSKGTEQNKAPNQGFENMSDAKHADASSKGGKAAHEGKAEQGGQGAEKGRGEQDGAQSKPPAGR